MEWRLGMGSTSSETGSGRACGSGGFFADRRLGDAQHDGNMMNNNDQSFSYG